MLGLNGPRQETANTTPDGATNSRITVPVGVCSSWTVYAECVSSRALAARVCVSAAMDDTESPSAAQLREGIAKANNCASNKADTALLITFRLRSADVPEMA